MPQLSELPADLIMVSLFPFLSTSSLVSLGCTSRLWYSSILATDSLTANALWKKRLAEDRNFPVNNTARQHGWLHLYKAAFFPRIYVWGQQGQGRLGLT